MTPSGSLRPNGLCSRRWYVTLLAFLLVFAVKPFPASAQVYSGSLTGVITDPSGAVVPAAKVALVDVNKGYSFTATSDSVGRYVIRNLPPSTYKLTVEATGFQAFAQAGIVLEVNQNANIDVTLKVGTATQAVEVSATAPALSTQDSTTGQDINRTYINDLPLVGRSVYDLTFLAPGINPAPGAAFGTPSIGNNFTSNGGRNATADFLLDGVSTSSYEQNTGILMPLYTPSVDAVQEYNVEQNNFSADKGLSGNTVVNVVMRSGTNNFHGTLYEFDRNSIFDSNNWFNNRNGIKLPPLRYNDFGGAFGGPIQKNKTFFFADYEGSRTRTLSTFAAGVPSQAERNGNFGELCGGPNGPAPDGTFNAQGVCSDPNGQLWDPYSGVYDPNNGGPDRSVMIPFNNLATFQSAGNPNLNGTGFQLPAAPGNLINPTAQKMMSYYPLPNVGVGTPGYNPYNNWAATGANKNRNDQFDVRVDRQFGDGSLLTTKFFLGHGDFHGANCFGNALDPCTQGPSIGGPWGGAVNFTHNFGPRTVLTVSYGFTRSWSDTQGIGKDFPNFNPVTTLGLPSYMGRSGIDASPVVYIYGGYQMAAGEALGAQAWSVLHYALETHDLLASLDHMQGRHEFKYGGEVRMHRDNFLQPGAPEGVFVYDFTATSQQPFSGGGDAMASFLTGVGGPGSWGEYEIPLAVSTQNFEYAGYFQDNWHASDKLTLNLGLRYDVVLPRTERYNRMEWFNPNVTSPLQVPGLPTLHGGLQFPGSGNRYPVNTDWSDWQPRVGLAYRISPKTVLRGGYGFFYSANQFGAAGTGPGGFDGFLQVTNWINTYKNDGATPWALISNPFPGGLIEPPGSSLGLNTNIGLGIDGPIRTWNQTPYVQTWSLGFQHELPGNTLVEMNYVGTKGTHLYFGGAGSMSTLGPWVEKASSAQITALNTLVPNPFYGVITNPSSCLSGPTISQTQLDLPFPEFCGVSPLAPPWANSIYHAYQLRVEHRFAQGLQFLVNYTISKSIDDASVKGGETTWLGGFTHLQDPNNFKIERSLSEYDIPQNLTFTYVYQLPVGHGKRWGANWNRWVDGILGGWQTNGIWRLDNGFPVHLGLSGGTSLPTYGGQSPNLLAPLRVNGSNPANWIGSNGQYFANPQDAVLPAPYTVGTAPRELPNVRTPGTNTAALSIFKEIPTTKLREGSHLEFRAESFNTFNHPQFGCLDTTVNTGSFGQINCQANSPREVQLGLKLYF